MLFQDSLAVPCENAHSASFSGRQTDDMNVIVVCSNINQKCLAVLQVLSLPFFIPFLAIHHELLVNVLRISLLFTDCHRMDRMERTV